MSFTTALELFWWRFEKWINVLRIHNYISLVYERKAGVDSEKPMNQNTNDQTLHLDFWQMLLFGYNGTNVAPSIKHQNQLCLQRQLNHASIIFKIGHTKYLANSYLEIHFAVMLLNILLKNVSKIIKKVKKYITSTVT